MALLFVDSFDYYSTADITKKWTSITTNGSTAAAISAGNGARSTNSLRIISGASSNASDQINLTVQEPYPSGATCILGFRFKTNSLVTGTNTTEGTNCSSICAVRSQSSSMVWFRLNSNGTISAFRNTTLLGTSSFALSTGTFFYLEFKVTISNTVGVVQFRRDSVLDATLDLSGVDTNNGSTTDTWDQVRLGRADAAGAAQTWDFDDLYVCDGSGTYNNNFLGDQRIDVLYPNANGTNNDSTPSGGAVDRYTMVDETLLDSDTTYNTFAAATDKDTYGFTNHPVSGSTINGLQINVMAKKADAGTVLLDGIMRTGGVDYNVETDRAPATGYTNLRYILERSPVDDTTELSTATIDAAEFGVEKTA